jgi:hypothetical protein
MARSERTPTPEATFVQRLVRWGNAKLLNPPTLVALRLGIAPRAFALLETVGRRSGRRRLTPVGNGLIGNEFCWSHSKGCERVTCAICVQTRARG